MTIKQQGGIFGRNPTFNDAEVDDLTVTGSSTLNGSFSVQGTAGKLNQQVAGNVLQIAQGMNTEDAVVQVGSGRTGTGNSYLDFFSDTGATFGGRIIKNPSVNGAFYVQTKGTDGLYLRTDDAAPVVFQTGGAEAARFNTSGNLAFPSGQGIDFSTASGTGTSELLDDYEEGTWTPTLIGSTSGSASITITVAEYVKIGRLVTVFIQLSDIRLDTHNISGSVIIGGLPFTSSSVSSVANFTFANILSADETTNTISGYVQSSHILLRKGSSLTAITDSDLDSVSNGTFMVSATYQV